MCSSYYFKLLYLYIIYSRLKVLGIFAMNDWTSSSSPFLFWKHHFFPHYAIPRKSQFNPHSCFKPSKSISYFTRSPTSLPASASTFHSHKSTTSKFLQDIPFLHTLELKILNHLNLPNFMTSASPHTSWHQPQASWHQPQEEFLEDCTDPRCTYYPSRIWIHPISVLSIHLGFLALIAQACLSTIICQETSNIYFILSKVVRACELFTVSK